MNYKKIFVLFFILFLAPIEAHNRSESYSKFQFISADEEIEVKITGTIKQGIFRLLRLETKFQSYEDFIEYLSSSIDLGVNCQLKNSVNYYENNAAGVLKFFWNFKCNEIPSGVSISLFQDLGITHTHIARGSIDGVSIPEFMFANKSDYWVINSLSQQNNNKSTYLSFIYSGIEHILSGWDHLVFILGLLLLYNGRLLVIAITGFTVGHSLTLGLGAMNILRVHSELVEILIGFSILILAMEKFFKHNYELQNFKKNFLYVLLAFFPLGVFGILEPLLIFGLALFLTTYLSVTLKYSSIWIPLLITIFFGFIHGLGFASSISDVGIPQDKLLPIILSFNFGVEVGQLAIAFGILGLLAMTKNFLSSLHFNSIHNFAGTVVFSMGTFWFVSRAMGI